METDRDRERGSMWCRDRERQQTGQRRAGTIDRERDRDTDVVVERDRARERDKVL